LAVLDFLFQILKSLLLLLKGALIAVKILLFLSKCGADHSDALLSLGLRLGCSCRLALSYHGHVLRIFEVSLQLIVLLLQVLDLPGVLSSS
jgi:hypothetical protein